MLNNISVIPSVNNFVIGASRSRAHRLRIMKRKPLSDADRAAAANLRRLWDAKKAKLGLTQDKAAAELGFGTQGAVSHYLNAYTPLNTDTVLKFAALLKVSPSEIDPNITDLLAHAAPKPQGVSEVAREFLDWLSAQSANGRLSDSDLLILRGRAEQMIDNEPPPPASISVSQNRLQKAGRMSFVDRMKKHAK